MIAALFVAEDGPYTGLPHVDPWPASRDARKYAGPYRVVAHPPCERWGRYWSGGPSAKVRRKLGDDNGCFAAALASVQKFGGVLEHPEGSHAWRAFALPYPDRAGGWVLDLFGGAACCVEQGHYGHRARKATWLYAFGLKALPELKWGPSEGVRMDEGFHSTAERHAARLAGVKPLERLSAKQRILTPEPFRDLLLELVA